MWNDKKDDIFLSRWINGELSEEELHEFQNHSEYEYYVKILAGADALDIKEYDTDKALEAIKSKRSKNRGTVIKLWPYIGAAASIVIILGLFLFNTPESFSTNYGEQVAITLPDGSEMILNARSEASFDKKNWDTNRSVSLNGEAYFKVKKGSKFTVSTSNGKVTVLGTQFKVNSMGYFFEAICYEGKVSVTSASDNHILRAGKAFRKMDNNAAELWTFTTTEPSWITNTSSFRQVPISHVFSELEDQYNIRIDAGSVDAGVIYTGTFPNNDMEIALKTVFSTLGIEYSLSEDGKTVVLEK